MEKASEEKLREYKQKNPASICVCGHNGDGGGSEHAGMGPAAGHGVCLECDCNKFTWSNFTPEFRRLRRLLKGKS